MAWRGTLLGGCFHFHTWKWLVQDPGSPLSVLRHRPRLHRDFSGRAVQLEGEEEL